jgi:hypothetical protein
MLRGACVRRAVVIALLPLAAACTKRIYAGPPLAPEQVAEIHVGTAIVREIDGAQRRGGALDVGQFEVTPPSNEAFYRTVSDHLPIMVRLRAAGPDDD